jgi:uncharacterized alpha-E superfamily protein
MSRYLERAEHTARLTDVHLNLVLDQNSAGTGARRERLLVTLQVAPQAGITDNDYNLTQYLAFNPDNKSSIVSCIAAARENARQAREQISSEMWEKLNQLYLSVREAGIEQVWWSQPHVFFRSVKEGAHLFQGITDATMSHGEGWDFIQVGRFLERAAATATLLDIHFETMFSHTAGPGTSADYLDWVALLKSCTAFEAYRKVYSTGVEPRGVAEFLLFNPDFPHSIFFAIDQLQAALHRIADMTGTHKGGRVYRLAARLRAELDFDQIDEIVAGDFHTYLRGIRRQCSQTHEALYKTYIDYPIETALPA